MRIIDDLQRLPEILKALRINGQAHQDEEEDFFHSREFIMIELHKYYIPLGRAKEVYRLYVK